jgi:hypothetical protein
VGKQCGAKRPKQLNFTLESNIMTTTPMPPVSLLQALRDVQTVLREEGFNLGIGSRKLLKEVAKAIEAAQAGQSRDAVSLSDEQIESEWKAIKASKR